MVCLYLTGGTPQGLARVTFPYSVSLSKNAFEKYSSFFWNGAQKHYVHLLACPYRFEVLMVGRCHNMLFMNLRP